MFNNCIKRDLRKVDRNNFKRRDERTSDNIVQQYTKRVTLTKSHGSHRVMGVFETFKGTPVKGPVRRFILMYIVTKGLSW